MRKTTKGRNIQHIPGSPQREITKRTPSKRHKAGFKEEVVVIPAMRGKSIKHSPRRAM